MRDGEGSRTEEAEKGMREAEVDENRDQINRIRKNVKCKESPTKFLLACFVRKPDVLSTAQPGIRWTS